MRIRIGIRVIACVTCFMFLVTTLTDTALAANRYLAPQPLCEVLHDGGSTAVTVGVGADKDDVLRRSAQESARDLSHASDSRRASADAAMIDRSDRDEPTRDTNAAVVKPDSFLGQVFERLRSEVERDVDAALARAASRGGLRKLGDWIGSPESAVSPTELVRALDAARPSSDPELVRRLRSYAKSFLRKNTDTSRAPFEWKKAVVEVHDAYLKFERQMSVAKPSDPDLRLLPAGGTEDRALLRQIAEVNKERLIAQATQIRFDDEALGALLLLQYVQEDIPASVFAPAAASKDYRVRLSARAMLARGGDRTARSMLETTAEKSIFNQPRTVQKEIMYARAIVATLETDGLVSFGGGADAALAHRLRPVGPLGSDERGSTLVPMLLRIALIGYLGLIAYPVFQAIPQLSALSHGAHMLSQALLPVALLAEYASLEVFVRSFERIGLHEAELDEHAIDEKAPDARSSARTRFTHVLSLALIGIIGAGLVGAVAVFGLASGAVLSAALIAPVPAVLAALYAFEVLPRLEAARSFHARKREEPSTRFRDESGSIARGLVPLLGSVSALGLVAVFIYAHSGDARLASWVFISTSFVVATIIYMRRYMREEQAKRSKDDIASARRFEEKVERAFIEEVEELLERKDTDRFEALMVALGLLAFSGRYAERTFGDPGSLAGSRQIRSVLKVAFNRLMREDERALLTARNRRRLAACADECDAAGLKGITPLLQAWLTVFDRHLDTREGEPEQKNSPFSNEKGSAVFFAVATISFIFIAGLYSAFGFPWISERAGHEGALLASINGTGMWLGIIGIIAGISFSRHTHRTRADRRAYLDDEYERLRESGDDHELSKFLARVLVSDVDAELRFGLERLIELGVPWRGGGGDEFAFIAYMRTGRGIKPVYLRFLLPVLIRRSLQREIDPVGYADMRALYHVDSDSASFRSRRMSRETLKVLQMATAVEARNMLRQKTNANTFQDLLALISRFVSASQKTAFVAGSDEDASSAEMDLYQTLLHGFVQLAEEAAFFSQENYLTLYALHDRAVTSPTRSITHLLTVWLETFEDERAIPPSQRKAALQERIMRAETRQRERFAAAFANESGSLRFDLLVRMVAYGTPLFFGLAAVSLIAPGKMNAVGLIVGAIVVFLGWYQRRAARRQDLASTHEAYARALEKKDHRHAARILNIARYSEDIDTFDFAREELKRLSVLPDYPADIFTLAYLREAKDARAMAVNFFFQKAIFLALDDAPQRVKNPGAPNILSQQPLFWTDPALSTWLVKNIPQDVIFQKTPRKALVDIFNIVMLTRIQKIAAEEGAAESRFRALITFLERQAVFHDRFSLFVPGALLTSEKTLIRVVQERLDQSIRLGRRDIFNPDNLALLKRLYARIKDPEKQHPLSITVEMFIRRFENQLIRAQKRMQRPVAFDRKRIDTAEASTAVGPREHLRTSEARPETLNAALNQVNKRLSQVIQPVRVVIYNDEVLGRALLDYDAGLFRVSALATHDQLTLESELVRQAAAVRLEKDDFSDELKEAGFLGPDEIARFIQLRYLLARSLEMDAATGVRFGSTMQQTIAFLHTPSERGRGARLRLLRWVQGLNGYSLDFPIRQIEALLQRVELNDSREVRTFVNVEDFDSFLMRFEASFYQDTGRGLAAILTEVRRAVLQNIRAGIQRPRPATETALRHVLVDSRGGLEATQLAATLDDPRNQLYVYEDGFVKKVSVERETFAYEVLAPAETLGAAATLLKWQQESTADVRVISSEHAALVSIQKEDALLFSTSEAHAATEAGYPLEALIIPFVFAFDGKTYMGPAGFERLFVQRGKIFQLNKRFMASFDPDIHISFTNVIDSIKAALSELAHARQFQIAA